MNAKNLGLAAGILWGGSLFFITWLSLLTGYAPNFMALIADVYPGFSVSAGGSLFGLFFGFIDGFFGFFILAWIYNKLNG